MLLKQIITEGTFLKKERGIVQKVKQKGGGLYLTQELLIEQKLFWKCELEPELLCGMSRAQEFFS